MATLLEQFAKIKTLADALAYTFDENGMVRPELLHILSAKDAPLVAEWILKNVPLGTGVSTPTNPTPTAPVVVAPTTPTPTVAPAELLTDTSFAKPFTLTGRNTKRAEVQLVKAQVYTVDIPVESIKGPGVYFQFVRPDGSGFGYKPLVVGENTFPITAEATGLFRFSVESNSSTAVIAKASLTKKTA